MNQGELLPPTHDSLQRRRLRKPKEDDTYYAENPERVYAAIWKNNNRRGTRVNGFTLLEWILCPSTSRYPPPVSRRDAEVAASVIQWLGTNCGLGFIMEAERRVKEAQEKAAQVRQDRFSLLVHQERQRKLEEERRANRPKPTRAYRFKE